MESLIAILLLAAPILVTGAVAFRVHIRQQPLRLILAFSAAYLFSIAIMHMLPEALGSTGEKTVGLLIVLGFCLQLLIDSFSTGVEHGHVHLHHHDCDTKLPTGILVGLMLHSFLEGLPVYDPAGGHVNFQIVLGLGIHNLPITIAFVALLKEHPARRTALLLLFAVMTPFGYLFSYALHTFGLQGYEQYSRAAYALVIGIFLHISTAILFESGEHHRYTAGKAAVMAAGVVMAYLIS